MSATPENPQLEAALAYARFGWRTIPVWPAPNGVCACPPDSETRKEMPDGSCKSPGKHPALKGWQTGGSCDEATLRRWYTNGYAGYNIGVVCGLSDIVTVDKDPRNGGDETMQQLEREICPLPPTVTADTGGGGTHQVFRAPAGALALLDAMGQKPEIKGKLGKGVDLLREGRQFLVAPSVHPSGNQYRWRTGFAPGEIAIAELPIAWIARILRVSLDAPEPPRQQQRQRHSGRSEESIYDALGQLDQGHVLSCISGTWMVGHQKIDIGRPNSHGNRAIIIDGKATSGFIDTDGKIAHEKSDTGRKDGGPTAAIWCRYYGHDDKKIRGGLIEFVPELARFAEPRARTSTREDPRAGGSTPPPPTDGDHQPSDPAPKPEWEPPVPLPDQQLRPVPRFESDLLPPDLQGWVMDVSERMQVAPDIVAVAAMCALGAAAANARTLHPKQFETGWRVYTNLWGAPIAPAGSMKSPAAGAVEKMLTRLEVKERERFQECQIGFQADALASNAVLEAAKAKAKKDAKNGDAVDREDLAAALQAQAEAIECRPRERRIKATDTTIEALVDRAQRGKRRCQPIIIWRDELMALLRSFDREGHENDRQQLMEGWTVTSITVDRMSRGTLYANNFTVSIFGCMTPGPFAEYVREATDAKSGADGFLQRLQLLVYPDPLKEWKLVDRSPDRMAEQRAFALFERLFALDEDDDRGCPPALHFSPDAQELFNSWLSLLESRLRNPATGWDDEARRSHFSKYRSLMPAIALLCHLASGPGAEEMPVTATAVTRAIKWCDYLEAHAERVYAIEDRSLESVLETAIRTGKLKGQVAVRDLHRKYGKGRKAADVTEACEELERLGWLRVTSVQTKGRPSAAVQINPLGAEGAG